MIGKKPSAFTPVDTNRVSYVTPDLFAEPAVGKAIASSTPVPRALAFTRSCETTGSDGVSVVRAGGGSSGGVSGVGGVVDVGNVRMVLDFSSAPKTSGGESDVRSGGTPIFGALPSAVFVQNDTAFVSPAHVTPSHITPSPTTLPAHFTRQLLTAPVAPKKRVSVRIT